MPQLDRTKGDNPAAQQVYEAGQHRLVASPGSGTVADVARHVVDLAVVLSMADVVRVRDDDGSEQVLPERCLYYYDGDKIDVPLTLAGFLECLRVHTTITDSPTAFGGSS